MRKDNLHTVEETRTKLASGIAKIANAVGATMGTGGSNVIIEAIESPGHLMTNDGYTIVKSIELSNPIEEMARKILLEAINRANKASGDGSSTACVLTAAIIEEGMKHVDKVHPMEIKRSLEACLPLIKDSIAKQTRPVEVGSPALEQVATISAEDSDIGGRIAEIYADIGPKGIIHWDISKTMKDVYTIGSGITVEGATYISPYMCDATETGQNTNSIRLKNPKILITKQKIASAADFNTLAQTLFSQEVRDLVVFADDVDPLVIGDLIKTRAVRGFRIIVVKMPVLWKDWWFEDLSKATGAKIVDTAVGFPMKSVQVTDLGTCEDILITKEDTYLDGVLDMTNLASLYEDMGTDDSKLRASRLNTKTARYFVGAPSDSALSYRRLKVEDAISAAYHALNGGIVAGGGSALAHISEHMEGEPTIGGVILCAALKEPARKIAENAGHPEMTIGADYWHGRGFNSKSGEMVDMFEAGIVDPAVIVLNAVENAVSVAAAVLTAKAIVTLPRDENPFENLTVGQVSP